MINMSIGRYERISKRVAKSLFNEGKIIYNLPCKLNPTDKYNGLGIINKADGDFEDIVRRTTYKSCNSEIGITLWFYIKK